MAVMQYGLVFVIFSGQQTVAYRFSKTEYVDAYALLKYTMFTSLIKVCNKLRTLLIYACMRACMCVCMVYTTPCSHVFLFV